MTLARIEIEQIEAARWVAEVEVGGLVAKRRRVVASNFDALIDVVAATYRDLLPKPPRPAAQDGRNNPPRLETARGAESAPAATGEDFSRPGVRPAAVIESPAAPIGKRMAARMRAEADEAAAQASGDPNGARDRRETLAARKFNA